MKFFGSAKTLPGTASKLGIAAAGLLLASCTAEKPTVVATPVVAAPAVAGVDFAKAKGRWARMDGGYVLAINAVDADGRAEAAYFNPNPIKVAWGKVANEGATLKVNVELRDVNYPGCLYKLSYMPATDRLVGTYFQAQQQQTYDVEFAREPAR
jgi:hypothetical protein